MASEKDKGEGEVRMPFSKAFAQRALSTREGRVGFTDARDEGRIGAIFQQAANQICEQILMTADRRVNAAGLVHLRLAHDLFVERLTHAMKPLKLEAPVAAGHH